MLSVFEDFVREKYNREVLGVFELGSMAMGLANETSDSDVMVWVLPTWEDIVTGTEFSKQVKLEELNADVVVKDIRLVPRLLAKQNPSAMGMLNTMMSMVSEEWEFVLDDFWRSYNPERCFICNTRMIESDYKRYSTGKEQYSKEKLASRLWYTYDMAMFLKENKRYPENWELPHDGQYLMVKNGDFTPLYSLTNTSTKEEAIEFMAKKLQENMGLGEFSEDKKDYKGYDSFMKKFVETFKETMKKTPA